VLACGTRIEVFANLGSLDDTKLAVEMGAEGCGLLRTEFLFLERAAPPDEEEQARIYGGIANALNGRPLIVRTLDIGGDKPVAYLPFPHEDNPALGMRGIRFSLQRPDLFEQQLRAILRAVPADQCRIMLPMVVDAEEVRAARAMLDHAAKAVGQEQRVQLGIMVETPSSAMMAGDICKEADFLSIGSNDLTQYTLAMDRGNDALAKRADGAHPAVLRLIKEAARAAHANGKWIGICGGLASDPALAPLLVGIGMQELSATASAIPAVKARLRSMTLADCRTLAEKALACGTASEVRALVGEAQ
ncbi:MAG: phosphoenolpyruvate--protein phosphotransferase, partial [Sphingorhabdus sp.]